MTLQIQNRMKETCVAPGTSAFTLGGAVTGFRTFSSKCSNGDPVWYTAWDGASAWETGIGKWNTGNTLTRTTVLDSSTGSGINFANPVTVWADMPASILSAVQAPLNFLTGFTLSNNATNVLNIAAGQATDTTGLASLRQTSAWTKSLASWSAGSGGGALDTGTTGGAASTWYHWYVIGNLTTGAVDYVCSVTGPATGPTLPTGFTVWQWLFAWKTDGSKNWVTGLQVGDEYASAVVTEVSNATYSNATQALQSLVGVPSGVNILAKLRGYSINGANNALLISSPAEGAVVCAATAGNVTWVHQVVGQAYGFGEVHVLTNTSAQVLIGGNGAINGVYIVSFGWTRLRK